MTDRDNQMRLLQAICLVVTVGMSDYAGAGFLGFGVDSWKEEVLLHDGSKMVITRSQTYGGRHEIGQPPPIKEHTITFTLPGSDQRITWTSEYGEDIGRTNFLLIAIHVLKGVPYIVAEPNLCLSYNKWGRPNPPYVFFRHDDKAWQRISPAEFPAEFTAINVALTLGRKDVEAMVSMGLVPAENIKERNGRLQQPEHKTILREPVKMGLYGSSVNCEEMVRVKDGWISPGGAKAPIPMAPRVPNDVRK